MPLWVCPGGGVHSKVKLVEEMSSTSTVDGGADGAAEKCMVRVGNMVIGIV